MKQTATSSIQGFFPAVGIEEINLLNREQCINCGRRGIFYKKDKLIETLESNYKAMNTAEIKIVEIQVPQHAIMNNSSGTEKFGIKSKHKIPIVQMQSFEEAKKDTKVERKKMLATA